MADGDLRSSAARAAFERVRTLVARYVPPEVDLVEELIEERKREAALEQGSRGADRRRR